MGDNPYESPKITGPTHYHVAKHLETRRRGPVSMAFSGLLLGAVAFAIAGGFAAVLLVLTYTAMNPDFNDGGDLSWETLIMLSVMVYCIFGGMAGAVVGTALGIIAGSSRRTARRKFIIGAAVVAACMGGLFGLILNLHWESGRNALGAPTGIVSIVLGTLLGTAIGVGAGWLLGRILARICWGPAAAGNDATGVVT